MGAAMALAVLFFCLLLLSSAALSVLLFRLYRATLCGGSDTTDARAAAAVADTKAALVPHAPQQQELSLPKTPRKEEQDHQEPPRLAWRDMESLTGGFDEAAMVGRNYSSTVYLARLPDGSTVAVKVHLWCGGERRLRAFRQELDLLRRIRYPRIVALLAYSDNHAERQDGQYRSMYASGWGLVAGGCIKWW